MSSFEDWNDNIDTDDAFNELSNLIFLIRCYYRKGNLKRAFELFNEFILKTDELKNDPRFILWLI